MTGFNQIERSRRSRGCLQRTFLCSRPEQKGFSPPGAIYIRISRHSYRRLHSIWLCRPTGLWHCLQKMQTTILSSDCRWQSSRERILLNSWTTNSSKPRNLHIAQVMYKAAYLEGWGTGIKRMIDVCKAHNLPEPFYQIWADGTIVLTFLRPKTAKNGEEFGYVRTNCST